MARLFCRRASSVDAALVCDLLRKAEGIQDYADSAETWYAACFESWGLTPPPQEELTAFLEDLLSSAFLCQICEDSQGSIIGFMALGHSPIVACSMVSSLQIPPSLVDDPDVQEICSTRQNQWFHHWPQWLRTRHHCTRKNMNHPKQLSSLVGSEQTPSFEPPSVNCSTSFVSSTSSSPSTPSLSRGTSLEEKDTTSAISSETQLSNGQIITPLNTLWLLFFICMSDAQPSTGAAPDNIEVARAMLRSSFASMYELEWVLQLNRRQMLIPALQTRLAKMEDHDDLLAFFDGQTMLQSSVYGDYFVAELIGCKPPACKQLSNNGATQKLPIDYCRTLRSSHSCYTRALDVFSRLDINQSVQDRSSLAIVREFSSQVTLLQTDTEARCVVQEETARVLLALHWWGGVPLDSKQASTSAMLLEVRFTGVSRSSLTFRRLFSKLRNTVRCYCEVQNAFKQLSTTALRHFARVYESSHCFQHLPQKHKNAFALNIFGMKQDCRRFWGHKTLRRNAFSDLLRTYSVLQLYSQALDLLLPAFSLFPDKEYMIVLQPSCSGSSAACPLLTYFQLVSRKSCSTLQHCLYILHRQALVEPLVVQHMSPKEWQEASSIAASVGIRLGSAGMHSEGSTSLFSLNVEETQEARALLSSQLLVCLSGDRVVGFAGVSEYNAKEVVALQSSHPLSLHTLHKTAKLQQQVQCLREKLRNEQRKRHLMQCRFDPLPPLACEDFLDALEARATQGNVLLEHFAINPIFAPLQSVILREVMRLTGSQLLHIAVAAKKLPTAAMTALPLLALPKFSLEPTPLFRSHSDEPLNASKDDRTCKSGVFVELDCLLGRRHLLFDLHVRVIKRSIVRIDRQKKRVYLSCALRGSCCSTGPSTTGSLSSEEHVNGSTDAGETTSGSHTEEQRLGGENLKAWGHSFLVYDFLVLTDGTHDSALQNLGIRSWGLSCCRRGCAKQDSGLSNGKRNRDDSVRQEGLENRPLMRELRKVASAAADELLEVDEFLEEPAMGFRCLCLLYKLGIRVHTNLLLHDIVTESRGKLKGILVVDAATLAEEATEPPKKQTPNVQCGAPGVPLPAYRLPEDTQQALHTAYQYILDTWDLPDDGHGLARGQSLTSLRSFEPFEENTAMASTGPSSNCRLTSEPKLLPCRLLLTADRQNIDWDLLQAIQEAGLVYDGRMIVHHDFSTSDASIYAAGSLAEFHRRHRPTRATDLRQEKYCPDEVGFYLSIALGRRLMPLWLQKALPPLAGAFFTGALLDPRLLRPSRDIVMLRSSVGGNEEVFEKSYGRESAREIIRQSKEGATNEVRTDTLRLNWDLPESNGVNDHRTWQILVSAEGQVCVLKWDALTRVRDFRYLGPRPLQLLGLQQLLSLPITFLNKVTGGNCLICCSFLNFVRKQAATLKEHPEIHRAVKSRLQHNFIDQRFPYGIWFAQSLKAYNQRHEKSKMPSSIRSYKEETDVGSSCMASIGASWSEQRERSQIQLDIDAAENTLHPLLVHDVQRQLIEYLRQIQQRQDGNDLLRNYYIPPHAMLETGSKLRLERLAK
ncbi:hypothetical protein Emag_000966 [Eimeria magna]